MRVEAYYRRLAEKTGTPVLEAILLGDLPISELPTDCMLWTGRKMHSGKPRNRLQRDYNKRPYLVPHVDPDYGSINVNGKRLLTHRYLYMLLFKPTYEFRMTNDCGNTLCINPMHWTVYGEPQEAPTPEGFHYDPDEPWTQLDVNTLLDQALATRSLSSWEEVISTPLLLDCPHDLLVEALRQFRKPELLPHEDNPPG